jgi:hypothetical protein
VHDGDLPVQPARERLKVLSRLLDASGIPVESMNEKAVVDPKRRKERRVAAADVDDESSPELRLADQVLCPLGIGHPEKERHPNQGLRHSRVLLPVSLSFDGGYPCRGNGEKMLEMIGG